MHIAILQIYCGASGQFGSYNCQEVGLAKAFAALGHRCTVVYPTLDAESPYSLPLAQGAEALFLPARALGVHAFYGLEPLLERGVEQVLLLADNHLFAPGVHRFCRRHGIPCANYLGAVASDSPSRAKRAVMDLLSERNLFWFRRTVCFAKTPAIAAALAGKGVKAAVAPVALDLSVIPEVTGTRSEVRARLGLPAEGRLLLYVGRLSAYKRPLEMADLLAACPPDTHLVAIGKGELSAALRERLEALGLAGRCTLIESLPNAEVQPYYHAADAFINFNDHEIFGMSILEALYAGCPVIARHAPGPDFILRQGETGFLADTIDDFVSALGKITPAMGENAHREILERFQWSATARLMLEGL